MNWKKWKRKLENFGYINLFSFGKFNFRVWVLIFILLIVAVFNVPLRYSIYGVGYEGPSQEFVAVQFNGQQGRSGAGQTISIDGLYHTDNSPDHASKWDWFNPSNIHIDADGQKAGCPDLYFTDSGYGQVDENLQDSGEIIKKVEYEIYHNGKNWKVITYLYYFKSYVTLAAHGDENYLNAAYDEVDWNVKADVYAKVGINKWAKTDPENQMWAGILKVEVREAYADEDLASGTYFSPNTRSVLALHTEVAGGVVGQYEFDDFSTGWQNPDGIPDGGYYKLSLDFKVGKALLENKVYHPWAKLTVMTHVLVTHRFTLTDEHLGEDFDPVVNQEQTWLDVIMDIINDILKGIDIFANLMQLLIFIIIGFAIVIGIMIVLLSVTKIGGRKR